MKIIKRPDKARDNKGHMTSEWASWYLGTMHNVDLAKVNTMVEESRRILREWPNDVTEEPTDAKD